MERRAAQLPDDVLLEILVRLKDVPASFFRCATACKRWRGLIADPSFLRRCWPLGSACSSFQGFFTEILRQLCFVPAPRSALGRSQRALSSFIPSAPAGLFDNAVLLASRHGLLLLSLDVGRLQLAVCNPLAGTYDLLPPLKRDNACIGYAILTGADCRSGGPRRPLSYYKVLVVHMKWNAYMFSSDEASWRRISSTCSGGFDIVTYGSDAVVCHGIVNWLHYNCVAMCLCIVDVDPETGHVSMTKLVTNPRHYYSGPCYSQPFLSLSADGKGTLSVLWMQTEDFQVEIWEQQDNKETNDEGQEDDDISTWRCTRVIELRQPCVKVKGILLYILGEKCGTLLVNDCHQRVYVVHLETGIMEEVMNCSAGGQLSRRHVTAFEMDWPAFFVSRLSS